MQALKKPKKLKSLLGFEVPEAKPPERRKGPRILTHYGTEYDSLSVQELTSILPSVKLPTTATIIPIREKISASILAMSIPEKQIVKIGDQNIKYRVDTNKQVLVLEEGNLVKEFPFDTLVEENSRTGKSIDKKDAVDIANRFMKLGIAPQSKKGVFIKEIRKKIGLE